MTCGLALIWSGVPSAMIRPSPITTTQSEMSWTTSMSCSTNITVMPSSRSDFTWPSSDWVRAGFTPAMGSSSMTMAGCTISARAISSSLRCPPESDPANSSRMWVELEALRAASSARASTSASCCFQRGLTRLAKNRSPRWPVAPSFTLSSTVSRASDLVSWKVRTIP